MSKRRIVFETEQKRYFEGPEPDSLVEILRDGSDAEAMLNGRLSEYFLQGLSASGIPTYFIRRINLRETLIHDVESLPFDIRVRNRADEEFAKATRTEMGTIFVNPVIEYQFKPTKPSPKKPIGRYSSSHIEAMGWLNTNEIAEIESLAKRVNQFMLGCYWSLGYIMADITISLGWQQIEHYAPIVMVSDEVGPAQSTLWQSDEDQGLIGPPRLHSIAERLGKLQPIFANWN